MPYKNKEKKRRWTLNKQMMDPYYRYLAAERQRRFRARLSFDSEQWSSHENEENIQVHSPS
jgi:hypothetical protein